MDGGGAGLAYNQFVIAGEKPLLIHTGMPVLFDGVRRALREVIDPGTLRWISAAHASRPDEFGALKLLRRTPALHRRHRKDPRTT